MDAKYRPFAVSNLPPSIRRSWWSAMAVWLNPRRLRIQAIILICCLWGACAIDFSSAGVFDRAGNIKFQDFLQFYISAQLISHGRSGQLYDQQIASAALDHIVQQPTRVLLPTVYGPQVGLLFVPLGRFSFLVAASIWVFISALIFFACVYSVWRLCPNLRQYPGLSAMSAICFPPFFHFFLRGQISALVMLCFIVAFLEFRSGSHWIAGAALGVLVFKPQFLVAIPLVFLFSRTWKALGGLVFSAVVQLALTWTYFGTQVMLAYLSTLWHVQRWIAFAEPATAQAQMHSLRSFWLLLMPWPTIALILYILSSLTILVMTTAAWKSRGNLALRFSALVFAAILINPHLFVYDLLVLAPVMLLLADWALVRTKHPAVRRIQVLTYLAFLLPLLGPLTMFTHLQLSVPVFVAIQWLVWSCLCSRRSDAAADCTA
jgi:Glycosyltransferase family 87